MSDIKKRNKINIKSENVKKVDEKSAAKVSVNKGLPLRVLSRSVVIFSLLIVVYYSSKNNVQTFAKQAELLPGKGQIIECSSDYLKDIDKYEGCAPKYCKRFVTDKVISIRETEELLKLAQKGLKYGGSFGGASILDLHSGALSKGQHFVNVYKMDEMKNLFTQDDFNIFKVVKDKIKYTIAHHFGVQPDKLYLTHPTFFSEITSKTAFTVHDEYWHPHVDKETYKSFHYTTLLYLGDYNIDFRGGRFVFIDEKFNSTIEPRKGRLSMFTSGGENFHYVEKVTSGVRYAITISFTCDKKFAINDPSLDNYYN
ncbi:2-oxoglutarate and iron-dependent oxygenase domain-containing protein 3-like [Vanessa atalanta]|uniref:2-oxoglutarate and iron-dependent oxygenase domain-containing protein 3-like n=1 Tax=Vanessa atalanta TaxID=42275 RepID=UPI001FCDC8DF|nr:2-oxoglutarate and iron-dependent oxygenase domain-containing protein 3-like [Vanessa atalanta]XP_047532337.1 2-oxoglutarate and iron-dependent oxygenase domain-containing protein 3-like [Vanessa atalanta]XP_047532339.1 2-oxoglutarate and iron-dependent oxygenase domain-containing protein 3-like [Vanessa atalanta]